MPDAEKALRQVKKVHNRIKNANKKPRDKCKMETRAGKPCPDPANGAAGLCTNHAAQMWNQWVKAMAEQPQEGSDA